MKLDISKLIIGLLATTIMGAQSLNKSLKNEELTKGSAFKFSTAEKEDGIYFLEHSSSELKYFNKDKIFKVIKIENQDPDYWAILGSEGRLDFIYVKNDGEGDAFYDLYSFDRVKGRLDHFSYELGKYLGRVGKLLYFMPPVEAEDIKSTKGIVVFNMETKKTGRLFGDLSIGTAKFSSNYLFVFGCDDSGEYWMRSALTRQPNIQK